MLNQTSVEALVAKLKDTHSFIREQRLALEEVGRVHNIVDEVFENLLKKMHQLEEKVEIQYTNLEAMIQVVSWNPAEEIMRLREEISRTLEQFVPVEEPAPIEELEDATVAF